MPLFFGIWGLTGCLGRLRHGRGQQPPHLFGRLLNPVGRFGNLGIGSWCLLVIFVRLLQRLGGGLRGLRGLLLHAFGNAIELFGQ